jgi:ribosomal protein L37AE/L43A
MTNLKETIEYKDYGYNIVTCPICGKETLDNYWICEHCNWEYDGTKFDEEYSSVNNATIKEYRDRYVI